MTYLEAYADHSVDELRACRRFAEICGDWAEARRMTVALAKRGAFDRDPAGHELLQASRERRITPAEADEKARRVGRGAFGRSGHLRPI